MSPELCPISDPDVPEVAQFLDACMEPGVSDWRAALAVPWGYEGPNRGFMLREGEAPGRIVGAYVAYYSEQRLNGSVDRFCNLGTWCVEEEHRAHGLRLYRALLDQQGFHFTDLTPSETVTRLNQRAGFRALATEAAALPPWPGRARGARIALDPAGIERILGGADLDAYRDHAGAPAAIHAAVGRAGRSCYVVARRDRLKRLPVLRVLHVSDPELFHEVAKPLAGRMLAANRACALVVEDRLAGGRVRGAIGIGSRQTRMVHGETLDPGRLGYLYSELVCLPAS